MDEIPLFPVSALTVGPIPAHGIITIRLDFLTHSMQGVEEANPGRHYALTPLQARYLAEKILSALATLESGGEQTPSVPKH